MRACVQDSVDARKEQFYPKADLPLGDRTIRGLRQLPRQVTVTQARTALESTSIEATSLHEITEPGTFHELFIATDREDHRWVVKVNRLPEFFVDVSFLYERVVSEALSARQISHASVVAADCSRQVVPFDFEVMDFIDGRSYKSFDTDEGSVEARLPSVAQYLRSCHQISGDGYGLLGGDTQSPEAPLVGSHRTWNDYLSLRLDTHLDMVAAAGLVSEAERRRIQGIFEAVGNETQPAPSRLLHGDCGPHNAISTSGQSAILIDWEDALLGDPLFDLAMWATFNPQRRWGGFFGAYFESPWEPDHLFWIYFLRISLAKTVVRLRFGYTDSPGREPASLRIQKALAALSSIGEF